LFECLVIELALTKAIKMACLVANFVEEVVLFTFDNDCTMSNTTSFSIEKIVSFEAPLGFGMTSVTMGQTKPFASPLLL